MNVWTFHNVRGIIKNPNEDTLFLVLYLNSILTNNGAIINMRMRKKRHGEDRLYALSSLIYPTQDEGFVPPENVFGNSSPLKLEVGCGKGDFITALSVRDPGYNYIALERVGDVCVCAIEKYARSRSLGTLAPNGGWITPGGEIVRNGETWDIPSELRGNVRFIVGEASEILSRMGDSSLEEIIANFSDPWSRKCNYEKRRLTHPAYLENYRRVLSAGGRFSFKTDNEDLFDYTLEMLPQAGFEIAYMTRDLHASDRAENNIVTEYERNFTEQGIKIKMLEACPRK